MNLAVGLLFLFWEVTFNVAKKKKTYSTTHFSFMMLALKPNTANTTSVAKMEVKKLMTETSTASKWQLLSILL